MARLSEMARKKTREFIMNPRFIILAAMFMVGIAVSAWYFNQPSAPSAEPRRATVLPVPNEMPAFTALTHGGEVVDASAFEGQWDLVFFGFTHCPDICPLTLKLLSDVRAELAAAGAEPLPRIVLVSVDPERDTPEALGDYIRHFGEDNLGITGELEEIRKLANALGIYFEKVAVAEDTYTVDHSTVVLAVDPAGRLRALFSTPHKVEDMVNDLPIVMARQ